MAFLSKIIGLKFAETACDAVVSKLDDMKAKREVIEAEREARDLENLEKLKKLYDAGVITKREYKRKKRELMNK